ncbi:MAG: DUF2497 domain-containing protein [Proteobacteria bacterium]|nr:DUF2497 domain-containing protein [Pseudomonadota bacterium]
MSEPKSANPDPSMDDILASIRKIISADEARAQVGGMPAGPAARAPAPTLHAVATPAPGPRVVEEDSPQPDLPPIGGDPAGFGRDDVLLLTDLIEEPRSDKAPPPMPLPRIDPVRAGDMPQPSLAPEPAPAVSPSPATLVEGGAASSAAQAFARLSQAVQDSVLPAAAAEAGPAVSAGGKTVEDLARELLRPMLKDWLDHNLPALVERLVEQEISRLTRR